jgi:hypothetical protein
MAALGRVLQVVGWLWVVYGFVSPAFGLPDLSFFPGIILVFIARILRNIGQRREIPDLGEEEPEAEPEPAPPPRMMNTERQRQARQEGPELPVLEPEPESPPPRRDRLLDQIAGAGPGGGEAGLEPESEEEVEPVPMPSTRKPLSSAEMIARAHERWDSKPR